MPALVSARPLYEEERFVGVLAVFTDITALKTAQEELRESEAKLERARRMESLGVLAGGVAHDLNNILAVILGLASALEGMLEQLRARPAALVIGTTGYTDAQLRALPKPQRMAGTYICSMYSLIMRRMLKAARLVRIDSFITCTQPWGTRAASLS